MTEAKVKTGGSSRPEPTGMTLMDLVTIVAGSAVLASFHWWSINGPTQIIGRPGPAPPWFSALIGTREFADRACLALIPVILARRFQYGGLLRPAELLAAAFGLPQLVLAIQHWPILGLLEWNDRSKSHIIISHDQFIKSLLFLALIGLLGAVGFAVGRRRVSGGFLSILLLVAFLGLNSGGGGYLVFEGPKWIAGWFQYDTPPYALTYSLLTGILFFFPALPAVAALQGYWHRGRPPTWLEWICFTLALVSFLTAQGSRIARSTLEAILPFWPDLVFRYVIYLGVLGLSLLIVRRIGPAWDCRAGIDYH